MTKNNIIQTIKTAIRNAEGCIIEGGTNTVRFSDVDLNTAAEVIYDDLVTAGIMPLFGCV